MAHDVAMAILELSMPHERTLWLTGLPGRGHYCGAGPTLVQLEFRRHTQHIVVTLHTLARPPAAADPSETAASRGGGGGSGGVGSPSAPPASAASTTSAAAAPAWVHVPLLSSRSFHAPQSLEGARLLAQLLLDTEGSLPPDRPAGQAARAGTASSSGGGSNGSGGGSGGAADLLRVHMELLDAGAVSVDTAARAAALRSPLLPHLISSSSHHCWAGALAGGPEALPAAVEGFRRAVEQGLSSLLQLALMWRSSAWYPMPNTTFVTAGDAGAEEATLGVRRPASCVTKA